MAIKSPLNHIIQKGELMEPALYLLVGKWEEEGEGKGEGKEEGGEKGREE